jgi:hypothetical protein
VAPLKLPLQLSCPNCQHGNLPGSPYCGRCGAPLVDVAPSTAPLGKPPGAPALDDAITNSLGEGQDPGLVKQSYDRASAIMTSGEKIGYIAVAGRAALGHAPDCVVTTNKRLLVYRKKVLGKYELDDCYWRDVAEASMKESKGGVTLTFTTIQRWHLTVEALPMAQARRVYQIAAQQSERLGELVRTTQTLATGDLNTGPTVIAPSSVSVAPAVQGVPATPVALAPAVEPAPALPITPLPIRPGPAWPTIPTQVAQADTPIEPSSVQAVPPQPSPVITQLPATNLAPTPESVLQTILQQSQATPDGGAPTRPMQFSAAAFQAPALADAQSVTFRETDTEPHMRPVPPMPTLEQIAVFSGPLAFDHDSSPLTPLPGSGPLVSASGPISGSLLSRSVTDGGPLHNADISDGKSQGENSFVSLTREELFAGEPAPMAHNFHQAVDGVHYDGQFASPGIGVPTPQDDADADGEAAGSSSLPGAEIPVPGSHSSGPLLAAATSHGLGSEVTEPVLNSGGLSTQRLYSDGSLDSDADRPTDINLGQYGVSGPLSANNSRNLGTKTPAARSANGPAPSRTGQGKSKGDDPISKMKQLKMLLDSGFITTDDYEAKKADILARFF